MTLFGNGIEVVERWRRPSPLLPAKLDFYWILAGSYTDPFQVCSVHVFVDEQFGSAKKYVNGSGVNYGLVSSTSQNYIFRNWSESSKTEYNDFDANVSACPTPLSYWGDNSGSSIYKTGMGKFSVLLTPQAQYWSSVADFQAGPEGVKDNTASGSGGYIDIWTLVDVEGSKAKIYVNNFKLSQQGAVAISEPVEIMPSNKLVNRYIMAGSNQEIKVKTFFNIDNEPISQSIRNIMEAGSLISNPAMRITKLNESPNFDSRVIVVDFPFSTENIRLSSHDTISYLWNTAGLNPEGGPQGVYEIQVQYDILDQTFFSDKFKLIVR